MNEEIPQKDRFTEQQVNDLMGFSETLKRIHYRLLAEGYKIEDGKITPPKEKMV